jgi:hypothetical protein
MFMSFDALFNLARGTLLIAPLLGLLVAWGVRKVPAKRLRYLYATIAIPLLVATVVAISPWSFRGTVIDAWLVAADYLAYCIGTVVATLRMGFGPWRNAARVVATAPIAIGYLLGTVGYLGLAFGVGDFEPTSIETLSPGLSYRTYDFGNATTRYGGTIVEVYAQPRAVPFIERRLCSDLYLNNEHDLNTITVRLERENGGVVVAIREGGRLLRRLTV